MNWIPLCWSSIFTLKWTYYVIELHFKLIGLNFIWYDLFGLRPIWIKNVYFFLSLAYSLIRCPILYVLSYLTSPLGCGIEQSNLWILPNENTWKPNQLYHSYRTEFKWMIMLLMSFFQEKRNHKKLTLFIWVEWFGRLTIVAHYIHHLRHV